MISPKSENKEQNPMNAVKAYPVYLDMSPSPMVLIPETSKYIRQFIFNKELISCELLPPIDLRVPKTLPMFGCNSLKSSVEAIFRHKSPTVRQTEPKRKNMENKGTCRFNEAQIEIMARLHRSLGNGIRSGKANIPRQWMESKKLNIVATGACFNSGQVHHRKPQDFKNELESIGFLTISDASTNNRQTPYAVFGMHSVVFPLRNQDHQVVNLYAVNIKNGKTDYLNKEGIYPCYPNETTKKLYIVPNVIDAATMLSANILDNKETVIALHNGILLPQHEEAIKRLTLLKEIIWIEYTKN